MMKKTFALAAGALLAANTTGCAMFGGSIEGIWLFSLAANTETTECDENVDHNHEDAEAREETDDSDWEYVDEQDLSDALVVGQIVLSDKKSGVLFLGGAAYPGAKQDGGGWKFSWEGVTDSKYEETFDGADYEYSYEAAVSSTQSIVMNVDGKIAGGSVSSDYSSSEEWKEVDEWDDVDCPSCGFQVPFGTWLDVEEDGGPGGKSVTVPAYNSVDEECDGGECELTVETTCPSVTQQHTATWLGYSDEGAYDGIDQGGQAYGAN